MRRADIVMAAILIPAWIGIVFYLIPNYVGPGDDIGLQPTFMPTVAAAAGLVLVIAMLVHRLWRMPRGGGGENPMPLPSWIFLLGAIATFTVGLTVMFRVGYLYGGPLIIAGFMALARAKLWHAVATVVAVPLGVWAAFWYVLGIPLP